LGDKIEKNEMGRACSAYGRERLIQGLLGKTEGKRPLRRPMRRWEDNIKFDIQEWDDDFWAQSNWFRIGAVGGHL